jgi:hypothetical protein
MIVHSRTGKFFKEQDMTDDLGGYGSDDNVPLSPSKEEVSIILSRTLHVALVIGMNEVGISRKDAKKFAIGSENVVLKDLA